MKNIRRDSTWVNNIRDRIAELNKSGDAQQIWQGHQLRIALSGCYAKSIDYAIDCLQKLDVAAQEGSKLPSKQLPKRTVQWSEGYYRFHNLANYAKEIVEKAERKAHLRLDGGSSDQDYFDVIASLANDERPAICRHHSKLPGSNFSLTLMNLCRAELMTVPSKPNLSFYLEYLEQKLGVYRHEHIVFKPKATEKKPEVRKSRRR
jgi:hypothetical protein